MFLDMPAKYLQVIFVLLESVAFSVSPRFAPGFRAEGSPRDAGPCRPGRRHVALLPFYFRDLVRIYSKSFRVLFLL